MLRTKLLIGAVSVGCLTAGTGCSRRNVEQVESRPRESRNSLDMVLVQIPVGEFRMGSDRMLAGEQPDGPEHTVEISRPFWIGKYEVTQAEYERVMQVNPSYFGPHGDGAQAVSAMNTSRLPVDHVTWEEAIEFCRRLNALPEERRAGRVYRLPTEAEWEYACRAGTTDESCFGNSLSTSVANISAPATHAVPVGHTTLVGSHAANRWGLHDTHGNVWEWCLDGRRKYSTARVTDPNGGSALAPSIRGGAWDYPADYATSYHRQEALRGYVFFGIRVACGWSGNADQ